MSKPTKTAQNVWTTEGGQDFLQLSAPGNDVLSWIDSTGAPQGSLQTAIPSLTNAIIGKSYSITANGQFVYDAVSVLNSYTITSATANFSQNDVGKIVFGISSLGTATSPPQGTIQSVVDAHTITVSVKASANHTGVILGWGTDDTAACNAAWAAALAAETFLVLPSGNIFVQQSLFNASTAQTDAFTRPVGLVSDGGTTCLCPTPNFDFSTAKSSSAGLFFDVGAGNVNMLPNYFVIRDIAVYGAYYTVTGGSSNSVFKLTQTIATSCQVWGWGGIGTAFKLTGPVYAFWCSNYGNTNAVVTTGIEITTSAQSVELFTCYGWGKTSLLVDNGGFCNSYGSQWGQSTQSVEVTISTGGILNSYGEIFSGASGGALSRSFDVSGILNLNGAQINNTANQYGLNIKDGGKAFVSKTKVNLSAVSAIVANIAATGIYVDDGTNTITAGLVPGLAIANITPDTNWGTSGAAGNGVSAVSGDIRRFQFTITAAGVPNANPTVVIALPWTLPQTPFFICKQVGGTGSVAAITGEASANTTGLTLIWNGTPVAGDTYIIQCISE